MFPISFECRTSSQLAITPGIAGINLFDQLS